MKTISRNEALKRMGHAGTAQTCAQKKALHHYAEQAQYAEVIHAMQVLLAGCTTPTNGVTRAPSWEAVERAAMALRPFFKL